MNTANWNRAPHIEKTNAKNKGSVIASFFEVYAL
jgi:hypothetical protein